MKELGQDSRGNFKKFIRGETFYLGTKEQEAQIRAIRLQQVWDVNQSWDGIAKQIGLAIARGETEYTVGASTSTAPALLANRIATLQADFPMIRFVAGSGAEAVQEEQRQTAKDLRREANIREHGIAEGLPFYTAMDRWLEQSINLDRDTTGKLTESAIRVHRNVKILKDHHDNFPMTSLDLVAIDKLLAYWSNRPIVRKFGKPAAKTTCKEQIKVVRRFLRWAARANLWAQPNGYSVTPIRIRTLPHEREAQATAEQVKRFKRDELQTLWTYARPLERLFMVLALNTGFGQRELITLRQADIQGNKIKRVRHKSGVYGEWTLWPETVQAIEWYRQYYRPRSDAPEFLVTRNGRPLSARSEAGNHSREIANAWTRLIARVRKDEETKDFRKLSFNKLRKTAASLVRKAASGEIAGTFLCHGRPVKDDDLSEIYSNRDFRKVFKALRRVRKHLAPVFATVAEPFPPQAPRKVGIPPGKIKRIRELRKQGYTAKKAAEIVGVSDDTVRKYTKAATV